MTTTPSSSGLPVDPTRDPLFAEVDDLRAEVERVRLAGLDALLQAEKERRAEVERVRGALRDAYGKLWNQAEADHARADAAETKVRAVEALHVRVLVNWPGDYRCGVCCDGNGENLAWPCPTSAALADMPSAVTPPAEPCPYETRYALHSNGMKCCDEDGA